MNKLEILAILPYRELVGLVEKRAEEYSNIHVDCFVGDLDQGVEIARKQLKSRPYDLLLSRGGTAELLRKNITDIAILEIPVSFEDIFYAIMLARNYQEKFAVVSFPALAKQARSLCELLGFDINVWEIHSKEEVRRRLTELMKNNCSMVVGDVITAQMAREMGLNVVLVMSGQNSVNQALDYACWMLPMKRQQHRSSQYLSAMESNSPFMTAVIDEKGNIAFNNFRSKDLATEEFSRYFLLHIQTFKKKDNNPFFQQIGKNLFMLHALKRTVDGKDHIFIYGQTIYEPVNINSEALIL